MDEKKLKEALEKASKLPQHQLSNHLGEALKQTTYQFRREILASPYISPEDVYPKQMTHLDFKREYLGEPFLPSAAAGLASSQMPQGRPKICPTCRGKGGRMIKQGSDIFPETCHRCGGKGQIVEAEGVWGKSPLPTVIADMVRRQSDEGDLSNKPEESSLPESQPEKPQKKLPWRDTVKRDVKW